MYNISGHHHISMITKNAQQNNYFYKKILGLRRVKVTVNQDDPSMYHLFYGDRTGSPGTELTFFEMPAAGGTHRGTNAITKIGLLVPSMESLVYWKGRFEQFDVQHSERTTYAGYPAVHFEEEGLRMVLLVSKGKRQSGWKAWEKSPVPLEHQILGMGPIEITVSRPDKLTGTLAEIFAYTKARQTDDGTVFQSQKGESSGEIVIKHFEGPREKPGRGSIHHLAIRARDERELAYWDKKVRERGFISTGIIDRYYFKSFYFRESNGILFEIATDGPGFTVDGSVETLGERLDLPPSLERQRDEIKKKLTPLGDI